MNIIMKGSNVYEFLQSNTFDPSSFSTNFLPKSQESLFHGCALDLADTIARARGSYPGP